MNSDSVLLEYPRPAWTDVPPPDRPWTSEQAATYLQVSLRTFQNWSLEHPAFPHPMKVPGRKVLWWGEHITAWARVGGHENLPTGGHEKSPAVATRMSPRAATSSPHPMIDARRRVVPGRCGRPS